ncbi:30S ribosomal protein S24e [Candidatus Woesearchaeota archaeon]|nr:30S ribosomal protein S24e [Candidatus Woesearchaeota archaeon]
MDIKVTTKTENPLLKRTEMTGTLSFTGATPAYPAIKQELAKTLKVGEELIAIKQVLTSFGKQEATFTVYTYETAEQLKNIEPKIKQKKEKKEEEKK